MREAEQVNGDDDVDEDSIEAKPTHKEALTAAFTFRSTSLT